MTPNRSSLRMSSQRRLPRIRFGLAVAALLTIAAILGRRATARGLLAALIGLGAFIMLQAPYLGLPALIAAALLVRHQFSTGTEVVLNASTLLVPILTLVWLFVRLMRRRLDWTGSRIDRPLALFLAAGLLSLLAGNVLWDPAIPRSGHFWLVQLAQWAIFAFSALALWLAANLLCSEKRLQDLVYFFLLFC